jgi:hypothetical protein
MPRTKSNIFDKLQKNKKKNNDAAYNIIEADESYITKDTAAISK